MARYRACLSWLAVAASLLGGGIPVRAENTPHIYATDWGLTLKADGTGFYNDLARFLLLSETTGETGYEIQPYRRAIRHFVGEAETCLYPTNLAFMARSGLIEKPEAFVEGPPLLRARLHVFSQPGQPAISDTAGFSGKTVAYALGASTAYMLRDSGAYFIAVADEVDKANLLFSGRVDLMTAALPDAEFVFRALGRPPAPFDPAFALDESVLSIVCHDTGANRYFLARLAEHVAALREAGAMAAFFRDHGLNPADYDATP